MDEVCEEVSPCVVFVAHGWTVLLLVCQCSFPCVSCAMHASPCCWLFLDMSTVRAHIPRRVLLHACAPVDSVCRMRLDQTAFVCSVCKMCVAHLFDPDTERRRVPQW